MRIDDVIAAGKQKLPQCRLELENRIYKNIHVLPSAFVELVDSGG